MKGKDGLMYESTLPGKKVRIVFQKDWSENNTGTAKIPGPAKSYDFFFFYFITKLTII